MEVDLEVLVYVSVYRPVVKKWTILIYVFEPLESPCVVFPRIVTGEVSRGDVGDCLRIDADYLCIISKI